MSECENWLMYLKLCDEGEKVVEEGRGSEKIETRNHHKREE